MLLAIGIVVGIVAQALLNISVVLALVPTKGIPLPFISYGGSSLVPTLAGVGILLNISQYAALGKREDYETMATMKMNGRKRRALGRSASRGSGRRRVARARYG